MPIVADAAVAVRGDLGPFNRDLKNADGTVKGFGARLKSALSPTNIAGGLAGGFAVAKVVDFLGDATQAAGVFQDTVAATGVIFTDQYTPALEAWAETAHSAFGASKQDALNAANQMAVFGKAAGLVGDDLVGFSQELVQLGGDLASMFGGRTEDAITAVGAALRGESEPIRRYGVLLDDATLRQQAFEMGIINTTKNALTPQQRVLAAHASIMKQTADAQGDFARTSGGLINQQRIAAAKLDNAMIELGNSLVPLMTAFAGFAAEVLPAVVEQIKGLIDVLIPMAGLLAEHADIIIPALVAVLGIHLVKSLKGVTVQAKLSGLAMKGMLGPIGLLLIAAEGLEAASDGVRDFMLEATRGKKAATAIRAIADEMADLGPLGKAAAEKIHDAGISAEEFGELVERASGDSHLALQTLVDSSFDLGKAMEALNDAGGAASVRFGRDIPAGIEAAQASFGDLADVMDTLSPSMQRSVDEVLATAKEVPEGVSVTLDNGKEIVAASAADLAQLLPAAIRQARRDAVIEALPAPAEIADALLAGKAEFDPVRQMIIDALKDPVSDAESQAEALAVLFDPKLGRALGRTGFSETQAAGIEAAGLLIDSILASQPDIFDAGTKLPPAIAKGFKATRGDVIQAVRDLNDDQAMTAGEVAKYLEDAGEEGLAALVRGIRSKKPAVEAAQLDMNDAAIRKAALLGDPLFRSGFRAGGEFGDGVGAPTNRKNAEDAGTSLNTSARNAADASLYGTGLGVGLSYGDGLLAANNYVWTAAGVLRESVNGHLRFSGSPPFTGSRLAGEGVANSWIEAIVDTVHSKQRMVAAAAAGIGSLLNPNSGLPMAVAGGGASPVPVSMGSGAGNTYNVTTASRPKEKTTLEIAHELRRAEYLNVLPGLNTNDA